MEGGRDISDAACLVNWEGFVAGRRKNLSESLS